MSENTLCCANDAGDVEVFSCLFIQFIVINVNIYTAINTSVTIAKIKVSSLNIINQYCIYYIYHYKLHLLSKYL